MSDVSLSPPERIDRLVRPHGVGHAVHDFSHACLIRLVDFPEMPLRTSAVETVKAGHTALIVRSEFPVGGHAVSAAYKRVRRNSWWKRLGDLFRKNTCLRNFEMGLELLRRGVATARPLAVIVPRNWTGPAESYLATEWIEGGANLYRFLGEVRNTSPERRHEEVASVSRAVGRLLGCMHARGVAHRDLKPGNILVQRESQVAKAFVVDLDGVTIRREVARGLRARNVSRLVVTLTTDCRLVSRTNLLRGLKEYLAAAEMPEVAWKTVWREISAETARRAGSRSAHA